MIEICENHKIKNIFQRKSCANVCVRCHLYREFSLEIYRKKEELETEKCKFSDVVMSNFTSFVDYDSEKKVGKQAFGQLIIRLGKCKFRGIHVEIHYDSSLKNHDSQ